jgi:lipid-A-disaccharide synthase
VKELVAETFSVDNIRRELEAILPPDSDAGHQSFGAKRQQMLEDYEEVHRRLGESNAPDEAARTMIKLLRDNKQ